MTVSPRRSHRALAFAAFVGLALGATAAAADLIADEEAVCQEKAEGDSCSANGQAGRCAKSKCGKNDYSDGVPPKHVQVDCLVCAPAPAKDEPAPEENEIPAKTDPKASTVEPTKTAGDAKRSEVPKTQGCANARIGEPSTAIGSSVLGLVLVGLAWRRRRTRRDS